MITDEMTHEQRMEIYAKGTRNAVRFIAWAIGIWIGISIIAGIIIAIEITHISSNTNQNGSDTSNCLSQGGIDPSC